MDEKDFEGTLVLEKLAEINAVDVEAAAQFFKRFFGFNTQKKHGAGLFLWNSHGFMMAINPLPERPVFPSWFHIGFRLHTPEKVRGLYERLIETKVPIKAEMQSHDDFVFFRCFDPTGYEIEIFWEPVPEFTPES